ncbi:LuxR C-terminal-related transcriptional regulator [Gloeobacter kilaueensis]|nr:response regulator transcription factor [Gloeobacter kilaueensis]
MSIRVVVVDDHPDVLLGAAAYLGNCPDIRLVAQAQTIAEALTAIRDHQPQVALVDLELPRAVGEAAEYLGGIQIARAIRGGGWPTRLIVMTGHQDRSGLVAAQPFVDCKPRVIYDYLLKTATPQERIEAIRHAAQGVGRPLKFDAPKLTPRERIVLRYMALGLENGEIAQKLVVAPSTVASHVKSLMAKILSEPGVDEGQLRRTRTLCVRRALEFGILRPDQINRNHLGRDPVRGT